MYFEIIKTILGIELNEGIPSDIDSGDLETLLSSTIVWINQWEINVFTIYLQREVIIGISLWSTLFKTYPIKLRNPETLMVLMLAILCFLCLRGINRRGLSTLIFLAFSLISSFHTKKRHITMLRLNFIVAIPLKTSLTQLFHFPSKENTPILEKKIGIWSIRTRLYKENSTWMCGNMKFISSVDQDIPRVSIYAF